MKLSDIKIPVSSLSGIGPQLTKTLSKVNIFTVGDLLQYYPYTYEDRTKRVSLINFATAKKVHTVAKVVRQEWFGYGKMKTLKLIIDDGTAIAELLCFNRGFLTQSILPGQIVTVTGQFYIKYNTLQSSSFEIDKMDIQCDENTKIDLASLTPLNSGIIPVYHLTEGLTQKVLIKAIKQAIKQYAFGIEDELPPNIIKERNLLNKQKAIEYIHIPLSINQAIDARNTLSYEELYLYQKVILERANKRRGTLIQKDKEIDIDSEAFNNSLSPLQQSLNKAIPFSLTKDQMKVIYEMDSEIDRSYTEKTRILNQLDRGLPPPVRPAFSMARLLQGDVGSG